MKTDKTDKLHYDRMMENALRGVVREALETVAAAGLPGEHHFYVTFRTEHAGVEMPPRLRQRHPEEMTIVLQHQFWDLKVEAERFQVTLSFDRVHERLVIPFAAITAFVDPSVQFGLQFPAGQTPSAKSETTAPGKPEPKPEAKPADETSESKPAGDGSGRVVALDAFRKKN
ncbi:MAG: SspB family protein [Tagaea sp.]